MKTRPGASASFSCLSLFPYLIVKIQNSFLCMCWRRVFCFFDHNPWETNLKSIPFKVVLNWKQCSCDVITRKVYFVNFFKRVLKLFFEAKIKLYTFKVQTVYPEVTNKFSVWFFFPFMAKTIIGWLLLYLLEEQSRTRVTSERNRQCQQEL